MKIREINLNGFRNLETAGFTPGAGLNILTGRNAQGKSNLLEAIYCLGLGRSCRTSREDELIRFGSGFALIHGVFEHGSISFSLSVGWERQDGDCFRKCISFNGQTLQKLSELLEKSPMVYMTADDLEIVRGEPEKRRRLLDLLCSRIHPPFVSTLKSYRDILTARNSWLKLPDSQRDNHLKAVYNEKLISLGSEIVFRRIGLVESLRPVLEDIYGRMYGINPPGLQYRTCIKNIEKLEIDSIRSAMERNLQRVEQDEIRRKHTLIGPHRDDFDLKRDGRSMKSFASFGEMRGISSALKLAEMEILRQKTGKVPIVLIDDCLNEMDGVNMEKFFSHIKDRAQIFLTTTRFYDFFESWDFSAFRVAGGGVYPCPREELVRR